ncbi:hypothetical protein EA462_00180 [Natrarchaeobius halalkaliphilus]|uniref:Uncharacterized protein n=1 Tax=Natrarchaeobius halalkaliphilus TaxID=1679091 RepID=A0A3N6M8W2_9EURY|nr:hypothetical protein EA462_00180 [Natrarchaeobius halalkaliphilus]
MSVRGLLYRVPGYARCTAVLVRPASVAKLTSADRLISLESDAERTAILLGSTTRSLGAIVCRA